MKPLKVLHITAHLGGGVGRVLSSIARYRKKENIPIVEKFICLESPENRQFISMLQEDGVDVIISPSSLQTENLIAEADITQLEWWHHPLLAGWMSKKEKFHTRLLIWCHISGLHYPAIPSHFISRPHKFLFTTPASCNIPHLMDEIASLVGKRKVHVVHSSGGFDTFPIKIVDKQKRSLRYGYLGTINYAKLHPSILDYVQACKEQDFTLNIYGDESVNEHLVKDVKKRGLGNHIKFRGYTQNPGKIFQDLDVFIYILNPIHYGTTENALLEAMACGVVPIVLNNEIESTIVQHYKTGIIIDSPQTFTDAIDCLNNDPLFRYKLSKACSKEIRERFSLKRTESQLRKHYLELMCRKKEEFIFNDIFGHTPSEWFLSCLGKHKKYFDKNNKKEILPTKNNNSFITENSKSSLNHFLKYYSNSKTLHDYSKRFLNLDDIQ